MRAKASITEEDLREALQRFQERGGLVHKIPAERNPTRKLVGARYGVFENPLQGGWPAENPL